MVFGLEFELVLELGFELELNQGVDHVVVMVKEKEIEGMVWLSALWGFAKELLQQPSRAAPLEPEWIGEMSNWHEIPKCASSGTSAFWRRYL